MERLQRLSLVFVLVSVFMISTVVNANSFDFEEMGIANSKEEADIMKENQKVNADEYSNGLAKCNYLEYNTTVTPIVETFGPITKETSREMKVLKYEMEQEGFTVTVVAKESDEVKNEYAFNVLNGVVTSSTVNNQVDTSYNEKAISEVLSSFENVNDEDVRIEITTSSTSKNINKNETKKTKAEAEALVAELAALGYEVTYNQNNTTKSEEVITSKTELTNESIIESVKAANPSKEILDASVSSVSNPSQVSKTYETEEEADARYNELKSMGIYENILKTPIIDYTKEEKVLGPNKFDWNKDNLEGYTEDVYTNGEKTGYKKYYAQKEVVSEAQNKKEENLTEAACKALLNSHTAADGWTSKCESSTSTNIEESSDNKIHFNDTVQGKRTWSHLDISIGQHINIIDETGNVVATNVQGTLSNVSVTLNGTTKLAYNSPTYDGSRLEVRQTTSYGNYTRVSNTDLVTINATITYTYNGVKKTKNITLEGYLHNKYNVCRQKNEYGGGFDLEFDITLDTNNKLITKIESETTWKFTASKPEQTKTQGYYEEYKYDVDYKVEANDEDYVYNVSYIATDYNVNYQGVESLYNVIEKIYDKYYLVSGEKTTYEVKTTGTVKVDQECMETLPGKLVVNYVTTDGDVLTDPVETTEAGKTPYVTTEKEFDGYKLVEVEGNTEGEYVAEETIVVTYIYEEIPAVGEIVEDIPETVPEVNTGINENSIFEYMFILSTITFASMVVYRRKKANR